MLTCPVCGKARQTHEFVAGQMVREVVGAEIRRDHPAWSAADTICLPCLNRYRADHVCTLLEREKGELTTLEQEVVQSLREQESVSENLNVRYQQQRSFGERLSDRLARFGGSWTFILFFGLVLAIWVTFNAISRNSRVFDPYPFILLNLVLSCLAAMQAPVIMMSQNRQEAKDRIRAEHDYQVNLKAELEIRLLHAKLDQLLTHQWQRLLEIQQMQMDLMEDLANHGIGQGPSAEKGVSGI